MDDDSWRFGLSTSSNHSTFHSLSDDYIDIEDSDEDDDLKPELLTCPFCFEDFDLLGLCCHIDDEHTTQAKSGTCPVCAVKVGTMGMMAGHVITKHEKVLKTLHKKKLRIGGSHSILSLMRKELLDKHLEYLHEGASSVTSSSIVAPDPLLSSFMYNPAQVDKAEIVQSSSSSEASLAEELSDDNILESAKNIQPSSLVDEDQKEKARRCEFVHGLVFSTIFNDSL